MTISYLSPVEFEQVVILNLPVHQKAAGSVVLTTIGGKQVNLKIATFFLALLLAGCNSKAARPDWCDASQTAAEGNSGNAVHSTIRTSLLRIPVLEKTKKRIEEKLEGIRSTARQTNSEDYINSALEESKSLFDQLKAVEIQIITSVLGDKPNGDKAKMAEMCKAVQKLFGVGDVAYTPNATALYLSMKAQDDAMELAQLGKDVCRLRRRDDSELVIHVVSPAEWTKLKNTSQLLHLKDEHFIACEGNVFGGVYDFSWRK